MERTESMDQRDEASKKAREIRGLIRPWAPTWGAAVHQYAASVELRASHVSLSLWVIPYNMVRVCPCGRTWRVFKDDPYVTPCQCGNEEILFKGGLVAPRTVVCSTRGGGRKELTLLDWAVEFGRWVGLVTLAARPWVRHGDALADSLYRRTLPPREAAKAYTEKFGHSMSRRAVEKIRTLWRVRWTEKPEKFGPPQEIQAGRPSSPLTFPSGRS